MNTDKTSLENESQPSCLGVVRRSVFAVIPDAERLDIGSNKVIAVFQHRHQAED